MMPLLIWAAMKMTNFNEWYDFPPFKCVIQTTLFFIVHEAVLELKKL